MPRRSLHQTGPRELDDAANERDRQIGVLVEGCCQQAEPSPRAHTVRATTANQILHRRDRITWHQV
jgi:hypothetical protein